MSTISLLSKPSKKAKTCKKKRVDFFQVLHKFYTSLTLSRFVPVF